MAGLLLPKRGQVHWVLRFGVCVSVIVGCTSLVWFFVNAAQVRAYHKEFLAAAYRGDAATVQRLGAKDQLTLDEAFRKAAHDGNAETVAVLLRMGANVNSRYERGESALMVAGADGCHSPEAREAIWKVLLQHGAELSLRDSFGQTALHWSVLFDDAALLKELLKRGVSVDLRDQKGATPLMLAAMGDSLDATRVLLAKGADPTLSDNHHQTVRQYARGAVKLKIDAAIRKRKGTRANGK